MLKTYIVDSFTNEAFKGNPAGVCIVEQDLSEDKMQQIAKELGLSETAFVQYQEQDHAYSIRFFSPKMEIPLCGHATLAASKVIFETTNAQEIHFYNIQDLDLHIRRKGDDIIMEFPVYNTVAENAPMELLHVLTISEPINSVYNAETNILMLEIEDTGMLRGLKPDFNALYQSTQKYNGVLITAKSMDDEFDFHSRYFWPWSGTNEDPVTGGTHTFLTPYWSERLGKRKMKSFQSSERTGFMEVELLSADKFTITSKAVIVLEGNLRL